MILALFLSFSMAHAEDSGSAKATATPAASTAPNAAVAKKPTKKSAKKKAEKAQKEDDSLPKDVKKLVVQDSIVGQGKVATKGKSVKVNYTGWLYDPSQAMGRGKKFDTSEGREPFTFKLGAGEVIKGWDEGFENMKVGGKRKLIIPADMGYGERGAGSAIPPNATLMFEVELLDVM